MRKETSTNSENEHYLNELCPLQQSIHIVVGRWTTAILFSILEGNNRFSHLQKGFSKVSKKVLAERISHLENSGIITKNIISDKPLNIEYEITQKGQELINILVPLNDWGMKWLS
jgi:DNA-binding HxlR family transcriptional regulator